MINPELLGHYLRGARNEPSKRYENPTILGGMPMASVPDEASSKFQEMLKKRFSIPDSHRMMITGTPAGTGIDLSALRNRVADFDTSEVDWAEMLHAKAYSDLTKAHITGTWQTEQFDTSEVEAPQRPTIRKTDKPSTQIESDWI